MYISGVTLGGKTLHPLSSSALPIYNIKSIQVFQQSTKYERNLFKGFDRPNPEGCLEKKNSVFVLNKGMSDYVPPQMFYDTTFVDIDDDAFAWWFDAPDSWAEIDDCGEWVCTGNVNAYAVFSGSTWEGTKPDFASQKFTAIPNNEGFSQYVEGCDFYKTHNGWICDNDNIGILHFKSLDADSYDRSVQPVTIKNEETGIENVLNSFMDHVWDGFYTGQVRESTFPGLIVTGLDYEVQYTGTPFKNMIYTVRGGSGGAKVRVQYFNAETYIVTDLAGNKIEGTEFDEELGSQAELQKKGCGENRFLGIEKILEFYLDDDCQVKITDI